MGGQQMLHLAALEILAVPGDDPHAVGIDGHGVGAGDDEVRLLDLAGPARSARGQGPGGVQDRSAGA